MGVVITLQGEDVRGAGKIQCKYNVHTYENFK